MAELRLSAVLLSTSVLAIAVGFLWQRRRGQRAQVIKDQPKAAPPDLWIFSDGMQPDIDGQVHAAAVARGLQLQEAEEGLFEFERFLLQYREKSSTPPPCLFIITTGDEEDVLPSAGAQECLKFLARKSNSEATLRGVTFAVLGLGDSNTLAQSHRSISWATGKDCNQGGELFDRWLEQIGGTRLLRRGESDARTDHDALEPWMTQLFALLTS